MLDEMIEGTAACDADSEAGTIRRIRLDISYDGTDFCGWQLQASGRTVQGVLEDALLRLTGQQVRVIGSGRTDSGVHALGQVAHVDISGCTIPGERFARALNGMLRDDIRIQASSETDPRFHARHSAVSREYRYYLCDYPALTGLNTRFVYPVRRLPDCRVLQGYLRKIVGKHDFTTFSAAGDQSVSRTRDIHAASVFMEGRQMVIRIVGNAFLWRMVRSIVGTMLDLEAVGAPAEEMGRLLAGQDRGLAGATAPPRGLVLHHITYTDHEE